jgi:hypothetical protein
LTRTFSVYGKGKADFCAVKGAPPGRGPGPAPVEEEKSVASATSEIMAFMRQIRTYHTAMPEVRGARADRS